MTNIFKEPIKRQDYYCLSNMEYISIWDIFVHLEKVMDFKKNLRNIDRRFEIYWLKIQKIFVINLKNVHLGLKKNRF